MKCKLKKTKEQELEELIDVIMKKIYPNGTYELGEYARIKIILREELK